MKAIGLCFLSILAGFWLSMLNPGIGVSVSVSIIGAGIISSIEKMKNL